YSAATRIFGGVTLSTTASSKRACKCRIYTECDDEDKEPIPQPKHQIPKPVKETPIPEAYRPKIPYSQRLRKEKMKAQYGKFLNIIRAVRINVPLVDVLAGMPKYGKFLKELVNNKHNFDRISAAFLSDESSAILQKKVPLKLGDSRIFVIPCNFDKAFSCNALADLGACINLIPNGQALRKCIMSGPYKPTTILVQAVDVTDDSPAIPELTTEMWEAIKRLQQGKSLNIQDVKTILFWEFGKFSSHDGETMESYHTRFYKLMNEMIRNNLTVATMLVNFQFLQQLQPEWSRFVTIVKQQHKLDEVSYHKLFDILKQYQKEVNELRAERLARNANLLALKNLALIAKYLKKIYKPTNNNLRTSSNSRNKNVDTTPRYKNDDHSGQFGNQRTVNVTGAMEKVGSLVVQQSGIQCFNCKEFGHIPKECIKPKRAEQYDWLADTDEEVDEQELEAHYSYMAKIQEVPTADSGTNSEPLEHVQNDARYNVSTNDLQHYEQSESVSNKCLVEMDDSNVIPDSPDMCEDDIQNDQNDVESDDERVALANLIANLKLNVDENKKIQKQLKKANTTLAQELKEFKAILAETSKSLGESISVRDSCLVSLQTKQTDFEKYKAFNDRTIHYGKLKLKLNETLGQLAQKDTEIKEGLKTKAYEILVVKQKHDELMKQSLLTKSHYEGLVKQKTKVITDLKHREEHDINKMLSMEKQLKFVNEFVYKRSQSIQNIHIMAPKVPTYNGRPTFANPRYLKQAQSEIPCLYAFLYDQSTHANRLIPDGEETLALERESRSKLNKDLIKHSKDQFRALTAQDMEILIQTCLMPLATKTQNDSFRFVHELKQEMHADLKYVESLKKEIDELEYNKAEFSNMYDVILQECVSNDVKCSCLESLSDLDVLDELQFWNEKASNVFQKEREQYIEIQDLNAQMQNKNIAISKLKKLIKKGKGKSMNTKSDKPSVVRQPNAQRIPKPSGLGVNHNTNVSRPQCKSNQLKDMILPNNSQVKVKKTQVEVYPRIPSVSNKIKSVTACKDSLNSKTLNANAVCATCNKYLVDSNHFACVTKMLNDVHARTKKPTIVPISTRKPKSQANKSVATSYKKRLHRNHQIKNHRVTLGCCMRKPIVQLIPFIVDSGCTKHMTGNLKLLCNFVEKFLVRFEDEDEDKDEIKGLN
nr:reverse transcriptase domain-containing protein [Tanacetum cinerariifolium]